MQLESQITEKRHFFADYFGKHFHHDLAKTGEYTNVRLVSDSFLLAQIALAYKEVTFAPSHNRLVINVQQVLALHYCALSTLIGK